MIQRIQSVYLVLGAVLLAAAWFAGGLAAAPAADLAWFVPAVLAVLGLGVVTALATVFLYGNLERQRTFALGAQVLAVVAAAVVILGQNLTDSLAVASASGAAPVLAMALPLVAYVLFRFARRGIEKDIALIRSMDRLR